MKQNLKRLFVLIIVCCTNKTFSQITLGKNGTFSNKWYTGTLVLKNKDTLKGVIKFENLSTTKDILGLKGLGETNKIFFKETKESKKKLKLKKDEVEYFVVKKNSGDIVKHAFIATSKKHTRLMQILIEGKVSLYLRKIYQTTGSGDFNGSVSITQERDFYYVKKRNEKYASNRFFANIFKSFKKNASRYFSSCGSLVRKINNREYKSSELFEIIKEYNNCK